MTSVNANKLSVKLPGLNLKNPIMPASGTFGFGDMPYLETLDLNQLGAIVVKTTTPEAREGNRDPKIWVGDRIAMNAVGLQNPGVQVVAEEKLPTLKAKYPQLPLIGSIGGKVIEDYVAVAETLIQSRCVDALELNISCPNVAEGGMTFGTLPETAQAVTKAVKAVSKDIPVYVKLSPNVTDIVEIAQAVESGGADGLVMINTLLGMHIDVKSKRPVLGNVMGGLSGAGIKPIAIRMIYQVSHAVTIPIIGVGGIETVDDIIEMYLAGASAVQIGTAHFFNQKICFDLIEQLPERLTALGFDCIESLRQSVRDGEYPLI